MTARMHVDVRRLQQMARQAPQKMGRVIRGMAETMNGDIVESFGTSPSSPGDPPGVDTDALRGSMHVENAGSFTQQIADGVEYGIYLELGTERMSARPFVVPVFEDWKADNFAKVADFVRDSDIFR